jgi:hypothetical protein
LELVYCHSERETHRQIVLFGELWKNQVVFNNLAFLYISLSPIDAWVVLILSTELSIGPIVSAFKVRLGHSCDKDLSQSIMIHECKVIPPSSKAFQDYD